MWGLHHSGRQRCHRETHLCLHPLGTDEWWSRVLGQCCLAWRSSCRYRKANSFLFRRNFIIRDSKFWVLLMCFPWYQLYILPQEQSSHPARGMWQQALLSSGLCPSANNSQRSWGSCLSPDNTTLPHPSTSAQRISAACQRLLRLPWVSPAISGLPSASFWSQLTHFGV